MGLVGFPEAFRSTGCSGKVLNDVTVAVTAAHAAGALKAQILHL
jgi:hypothetical protein